jgi:tetraacyldisaccharide 4'-kinase
MRAPDFWWTAKPGLAATLLVPAACAYGFAVRRRLAAAKSERAGLPVLCVGNLVAGGAGKTPVALDLAARLAARGVAVHFLTRGYGGRMAGPLRVDPVHHAFVDVGDEPLLLARRAPTWVARDRPAGARAALAAGAGALVMDDGFQNPSLAKDVAILVVDGRRAFGNGRPLPAGPLREGLAAGLDRADAVVLIGDDACGAEAAMRAAAPRPIRLLRARVTAGPEAAALAGQPVVAFAGIGDPEKFFATLRGIGCRLAAALPFPDHHPYSAADLGRIRAQGRAAGGLLVTTAKDAVRLPLGLADDVRVLTIGIEWEDEAALEPLLEPLLAARPR